jgi:uncharacterized protein (TIGR02145 family)
MTKHKTINNMRKLLFVPASLLLMAVFTRCEPCMDYVPGETLSDDPVEATGIKLCPGATTTRAAGTTFQMNVLWLPEDATPTSLVWESDDESVATVTNGSVTITGTGDTFGESCTIKVTAANGVSATCTVNVASNIDLGTPGWGSGGLGTITGGETEWPIDNGLLDIHQIWSDPIEISVCAGRTSGYGGGSGPYLADGRNAGTYDGTLFSWAAVIRFQDQLCPCPWRVPTVDDFINLDKALGGTGFNGQTSTAQRDKYLSDWGGAYGGVSGAVGLLGGQGSSAYYWSQSEYSATNGYFLGFYSDGSVFPQSPSTKSTGVLLRCVR